MATFNDSVYNYSLTNEGGYVNNPADKGGETNFGITATTARAAGYAGAMRDMTREQAVAIYKKNFWDANDLNDINSQASAVAIFDMSLDGMGNAAPQIQSALATLGWTGDQDGEWGPATRAGVNSVDPSSFLQALSQASSAFYEGIVTRDTSQEQFLNGWLNRAARLAQITVDDVTGFVSSNPTISLSALAVLGLGIVFMARR